jgi:hypothetical protein
MVLSEVILVEMAFLAVELSRQQGPVVLDRGGRPNILSYRPLGRRQPRTTEGLLASTSSNSSNRIFKDF